MLIDYEDLTDELRVCFPLRPYADVKRLYGLKASTLTMRLRRFRGGIIVRRGKRRIAFLFVSRGLDAWLAKPVRNRRFNAVSERVRPPVATPPALAPEPTAKICLD